MLTFFTDPYKEEILYSSIARYHYYMGNVDYKDTLKEVFGVTTAIPTVILPSRIKYLTKQLPNNGIYSEDYFISNHTLFPFYSPFLPTDRKNEIINEMKDDGGKGLYTKIGIVAGSICTKQGLHYCPKCVKEDTERYGEAYFHRIHQAQGVFVCNKHNCLLLQYPYGNKDNSRLEFIRLKHALIDSTASYEKDNKRQKMMHKISTAVHFLLSRDLSEYDQSSIYQKYLNHLSQRELLTPSGRVRQQELYDEFIGFYGEKFLNKMESAIDRDNEYNWLKVITRKPGRIVHPIRHVLFILFLCKDIEMFFDQATNYKYSFGHGPWYCLNPVADHFKQKVVDSCVVSADYKTREPVGTFSCSCGFIYSRKGPDRGLEDKFRVGRIKEFGKVWESRLRENLLEKKHSLRELARKMSCDPKTVVKFAEKLGMRECINSTIIINEKSNQRDLSKDTLYTNYKEEYSADILNLLKEHPEYTRTKIRQTLKKQYAWFYRNNKEWLNENLPQKSLQKTNVNKNIKRVDWNKRDTEMLDKIRFIYKALLDSQKPVRITVSLIGSKLGEKATLEKNIGKLPKTKKYLSSIIETVEMFQMRRVDVVCKLLFQEKGYIRKWEVIRKAGLRPDYTENIEKRILENIKAYFGVMYDVDEEKYS